MSGTKAGGRNAKRTEIERYMRELGLTQRQALLHYRAVRKEMASRGGRTAYLSGKLELVNFKAHPERALTAGRKGGTISRRRPRSEK